MPREAKRHLTLPIGHKGPRPRVFIPIPEKEKVEPTSERLRKVEPTKGKSMARVIKGHTGPIPWEYGRVAPTPTKRKPVMDARYLMVERQKALKRLQLEKAKKEAYRKLVEEEKKKRRAMEIYWAKMPQLRHPPEAVVKGKGPPNHPWKAMEIGKASKRLKEKPGHRELKEEAAERLKR